MMARSLSLSLSLSIFSLSQDGVLSTFSDGQTLSAPLSSLVADYYPLNSRSLTPSNDVVYSHDISVASKCMTVVYIC